MVLAVILNRRNSPLTSRGWCFCRKRGYIHRRRARIKNIFRGPARAAAGWTLILIYQARSILFRRLRLFGNHPERPSTFFLLFSRRRPPLSQISSNLESLERRGATRRYNAENSRSPSIRLLSYYSFLYSLFFVEISMRPLSLFFSSIALIFYESGNRECLAHYGKFKDKIIDKI